MITLGVESKLICFDSSAETEIFKSGNTSGLMPLSNSARVSALNASGLLWRKIAVASFASGESNMSYSIANLEHHHFKYDAFRRPGDLHVHLFGCPVLSFAEGVRTQPGDVFEIDVPAFGRPLVNTLVADMRANRPVEVGVL